MRLGGSQQLGRSARDDADEGFSGSLKDVCAAFSGVSIVALIVGLLMSFGSVEVTETALNYSLLWQRAETQPYSSGRYFVGPFNYFIRFPAVVRTIQFSDPDSGDLSASERGEGLLRSRTSDGLDVSIEISFQYQLKPEQLYDLYTTLGEDAHFHNLFVRKAMDRLTQYATTYSATEFFVNRTMIGRNMEQELKAEFERSLFSTVFSFQLRSVQLPKPFEDAIQETEVSKQDLQVATAEQKSTRVQLETELMKAERRVQVAGSRASAAANATMLANAADIEQFTVTQHKAADSYARVGKALDESPAEVLAYLEARVLRDHKSDLVTVGLNSGTV